MFCDAAPCVRPSTASASAACFSCSYHACCRLLLLQVSLLRAYLSPMLSLPALVFVFVPVCGQFVLVACVALLRIECCRLNACVRLCYHVMHPHELSCFVCASADAVQCRASAPGFCPAPVSCACACVDAADTLSLLPCMCSCPVYPCTIAICCGCVNMPSYSAFCVPWTAARACHCSPHASRRHVRLCVFMYAFTPYCVLVSDDAACALAPSCVLFCLFVTVLCFDAARLPHELLSCHLRRIFGLASKFNVFNRSCCTSFSRACIWLGVCLPLCRQAAQDDGLHGSQFQAARPLRFLLPPHETKHLPTCACSMYNETLLLLHLCGA